ncbi:MAG: PhoX family phosphatase [Alphaproteobacteria bacterium]|nr:PhoX family phosphatase [Alphaproteobacteria bacterium]
MLATTALATGFGSALTGAAGEAEAAANTTPSFKFKEVAHGVSETHTVAEGYEADILLRWGDPLFKGVGPFDPMKQSAADQEKRFGANCDFVAFYPLPMGSKKSDHGIMCVNHEYDDEEMMFPGVGAAQDSKEENFRKMTKDLVDIEMAAHGCSVVEVKRAKNGKWGYVQDSKYNRRISMLSGKCTVSGPAAGHARLRTKADPAGMTVIGTLNNCGGGWTPWGTYLTAEENFNGYFWGSTTKKVKAAEGDTFEKIAAAASAETGGKFSAADVKKLNKIEGEPKAGDEVTVPAHKDLAMLARYGAPGKWYNWGAYHDRFDVEKDPNEINRFGWIVEIDPYDPTSVPVKRTALGRFKHEGAGMVVNKDGRLVIYMGDDERFDYFYKYVSKDKVDAKDRKANAKLLDEGTLYVAKVNADGSLDWLPLVHGQGKLTAENGFADQAEVMIYARRAGDLVGATKMDRPEHVQVNPKDNKVYLTLTNNSRRTKEQVDKANPRAGNAWGQILETTPPDGDHTAVKAAWDLLVVCGDPSKPEIGAVYNKATSKNGWFACPDSIMVDHRGRLWVGTDQGEAWAKASGTSDGIWAMETKGAARGTSKMFWRNPVGAEITGIFFTPDDTTLFIGVQHPAADGAEEWKSFGKKSSFETPATRWPDFKPDMPPRASVVAVRKKGGGVIGG